MITLQILQGNYVIAGVSLDTSTSRLTSQKAGGSVVAHWVVVKGIQGNYVIVNDPFTNTTTAYSWNDFIGAANADGDAIVIVSKG